MASLLLRPSQYQETFLGKAYLAVLPGDEERTVRVRFASQSCAGRFDGHDSSD